MNSIETDAREQMKEAIKRIVANARESRSVILPGYHAARLFATYYDAHCSIGRIVSDIVVEACAARVAVRISRPD